MQKQSGAEEKDASQKISQSVRDRDLFLPHEVVTACKRCLRGDHIQRPTIAFPNSEQPQPLRNGEEYKDLKKLTEGQSPAVEAPNETQLLGQEEITLDEEGNREYELTNENNSQETSKTFAVPEVVLEDHWPASTDVPVHVKVSAPRRRSTRISRHDGRTKSPMNTVPLILGKRSVRSKTPLKSHRKQSKAKRSLKNSTSITQLPKNRRDCLSKSQCAHACMVQADDLLARMKLWQVSLRGDSFPFLPSPDEFDITGKGWIIFFESITGCFRHSPATFLKRYFATSMT